MVFLHLLVFLICVRNSWPRIIRVGCFTISFSVSLVDTFYLKVCGNFAVTDPGEGPGGPAPPYFRTKLRPDGPKKFFWRPAPPPPPYLRVWMTAPLPILSQGFDPALL